MLWAAVGKLFTALVVYSTRLTIVYAGFAVVVAALLWTYFGWLILLAGAQLSFYMQNPTYLRLGLQQLRLSAVELEQLALRLMYLVGRTHVAGGRRWTVNRLADELGVPGIAVAQIGHTPWSAPGCWWSRRSTSSCPARDIGRIMVYEILEVARHQGSGHNAPRGRADAAGGPAAGEHRGGAPQQLRRAHACATCWTRPRGCHWQPRAPEARAAGYSPAIVISPMSTEPVRIAPRASTSLPSATMSWYMSCRLPAMVISCTGIGERAVLDPEAARAARVVAGHAVHALPHQLGDQQARAQVLQERCRCQRGRGAVTMRLWTPPALPVVFSPSLRAE